MSQRLGLNWLPSVARSTRALYNRAALKPLPPPRGSIATPEDFLKAIGRSSDTKLTVEKWEDLWKFDGHQLRKAGLDVRDRRYIMWSMEKYRQGESPSDFAHEPPPKKTIRGWGPSVQNGKRIRSRRHR
ncbi:IGR protein motif-domain-containing protein [Amylocystis lapponica]|nr:IGR protein motif-domain-containing protein [Amylocystis lapponica]